MQKLWEKWVLVEFLEEEKEKKKITVSK